jgi:hypothetical protein
MIFRFLAFGLRSNILLTYFGFFDLKNLSSSLSYSSPLLLRYHPTMAALARAFEGMGVDDVMEETTRTLTKIPQCFTFRVPPRGPQGYSAKLLKENPMGNYALEIISKGKEAVIMLKKPDGSVYCMSPIKPNGAECYEKSFDSSRYFVLRLEDPRTGKTGSIGMGFNKRDQALEFKVTVQDFLERVKREETNNASVETHQDTGEFKLEGTMKIKIKVPSGKKKKKKDKKDKKKSSGGGISLSAPPPAASGRRRRKQKSKVEATATATATATTTPSGGNDLLGMDF